MRDRDFIRRLKCGMKRSGLILALLSVLSLGALSAGLDSEMSEDISGASLAAIQFAWAEYDRKMPHGGIEAYRVFVLYQGETTTVIFRDADWSEGQRGGSQFEVEMDSDNKTVIRSEFKSWR
jgi:hypothetical protein